MVSTLKSVHQKDKKTITLCFSATLTNMFISEDILDKFWPDTPLEFAAIGYYGMALHKTVPENCNTVTRGSQWGGGFYGYRLKFGLFYGYRLIFYSYG